LVDNGVTTVVTMPAPACAEPTPTSSAAANVVDAATAEKHVEIRFILLIPPLRPATGLADPGSQPATADRATSRAKPFS
jgi:hypothetical protein